jgi:hypothetical protein
VQAIHDAGFREVSVSPVRFVNMTTGAITVSGSQSPQLSHIAAAVAKAKSLGMRVTVNPFVEPTGFSTWRANYNPTPNTAGWTKFWTDYEGYLVEVAQMAAANGAVAMTVGTELNRLVENAGNAGKWEQAINAVDAAFTGDLGYAANWDDFANGTLTTSIWDHPAIDFLGVDAYFTNSVTDAQADASGVYPNATFIGQMQNAWTNRLNNSILSYAGQRKQGAGMPVVLTEVGYLPHNRTGVNPQTQEGAFDTDEQSMAFVGLINAADGRKEDLRAIHIWNWGMPGTGSNLWDHGLTSEAESHNIATTQRLSGYVSTAVPAFAADFAFDGLVDDADLSAWTQSFGDAPALGGDADHDGDADGADFLVWQQQYGMGFAAHPTVAAVPEPGVGAVVAAAICLTRRRRC